MIWHSSDLQDVLAELAVDSEKGLANGIADIRLQENGPNKISDNKKPSFLQLFFAQLKSRIVIALIIVALLSIVVSMIYHLGNAFSPLLIIAIVVINALVSAYHLSNSVNFMEQHRSITNPQAVVLRDGVERSIPSEELVTGDILILSEGDYIAADARIILCEEFRCNEFALTGESIPVEKNAATVVEDIAPIDRRTNMVYRGCSVIHGNAKAVVVATGLNTETGHNFSMMQQTGEDTLPMTNRLEKIGKVVNLAVLICCALFFLISILQNFRAQVFAEMTVDSLMNAVALAVAAIPEGLPTVSTIVIAMGVSRIVKDNIIIKKANALEILGSTSVILSNKTGILTRNKMTLVQIFDGDKTVDLTNEALTEKSALAIRLAATCSTLSNDSTEQALERASIAYNSMSKADLDNLFPKLSQIPFDAKRKCMTTINMINQKPYAIVKGAPEYMADRFTNIQPEQIRQINESMAENALRVICIGMKPLTEIPANPQPDEIEQDLYFVGLLGLEDPPRPESFHAIELCDKAGIITAMITGDNPLTAASVARRIGILKNGTEVITGEELAQLSDSELDQNIAKYRVFARVTPDDKIRIIESYQRTGKTVTATGDRIDDSDALTVADVGCAIGKKRTDIAKGSADIIINDNNFLSIVAAIKESRGMFENIRKSVWYLLSSNFGEILAFIFGLILFKSAPLAAVQLLWINLLTDCAPAIALCMEPAEEYIMARQSFTAKNRILNRFGIISVAAEAVFIALMTLLVYHLGVSSGAAATMAFLTLGMTEIFHCLNHKSAQSIFQMNFKGNSFLNLSVILTLFILLFLSFTPAGFIFGMKVLTFKQFLICFGCAVAVIPFCEIKKLIFKKFY
ncbi:MAG: cation-translocating P-type ATPase [Clostridia bacterium]|nr:cation-translocating P-type ATPase [Clostridia bacterium]